MSDVSEQLTAAVSDYFDMAIQAAEHTGKVWEKFIQQPTSAEDPAACVLNDFSEALKELGEAMMEHPDKLIDDQMDLLKKQQALFQNTVLRLMGKEVEPIVEPEKGDKRFRNAEWEANPFFDYLKQLYLIQGNTLKKMIDDTDGLSDNARRKVEYLIRQYTNAMAPSNFAGLNPDVINKTLETGGANLAHGIEQLTEDLEASANGALNVAMTDTSAFQVGVNVATTPGKVVYQNELMQLIQYSPTTEEVFKRPLLVIPPFINKYYIMDLRENNSLLRWLVGQGHTVFVISWVNPGPSLRDKGFDNYLLEGPVEALNVIEQITGEKDVNAIGYCQPFWAMICIAFF